MRVFLTGGSGYLGSATASALLETGHTVVALARGAAAARVLQNQGCTAVTGDLVDPSPWEGALAGCDGLVHAAALVKAWGAPEADFERVNVRAPLDLLDAARRRGVPRVVAVASLFALLPSPDGTPLDESSLENPPGDTHRASRYAWSKARMARAVAERQRAGDPAILVFPTVLLGPGPLTRGNHTARILDDLHAGRLPGLVGDGAQVWNLVGVADAARGIARALEAGRPGGTYILGGEDWTQERLVRRAAELIGVKPPLRRLGVTFPLMVAAASEVAARLRRSEPLLTRGEVRLYVRHWAFTSEIARRELGWSPRPVDDVLRETVTWLQETIWRRG